jgi:hypothetical protein
MKNLKKQKYNNHSIEQIKDQYEYCKNKTEEIIQEQIKLYQKM